MSGLTTVVVRTPLYRGLVKVGLSVLRLKGNRNPCKFPSNGEHLLFSPRRVGREKASEYRGVLHLRAFRESLDQLESKEYILFTLCLFISCTYFCMSITRHPCPGLGYRRIKSRVIRKAMGHGGEELQSTVVVSEPSLIPFPSSTSTLFGPRRPLIDRPHFYFV